MTGSRRTSLARGGPGRSVAPRTARLSWSPSVARLGQPFMLWNVVHHCEHRALVRMNSPSVFQFPRLQQVFQ
jgi:hypothetical protein